MVREISAGGVVLREIAGMLHVALIEPQKEVPEKERPAATKLPRKRVKAALAQDSSVVRPWEAEAAGDVPAGSNPTVESAIEASRPYYSLPLTWAGRGTARFPGIDCLGLGRI